MRKVDTQSYTSAAASANGLAAAVAYAAGGYALSATSAGDSLAHPVTVTGIAVTNHSGKTFTVTGTNENDQPLSQNIAGPNGAVTVTTTAYFKTVSSITVSSTTGVDTFNIGWAVGAIGAWIRPVLETNAPLNIGIGCTVGAGTPNFGIRYTYDGSAWFNHASLAAKTANADGAITAPVAAFQLIWTAAGQVTLTAMQSGT